MSLMMWQESPMLPQSPALFLLDDIMQIIATTCLERSCRRMMRFGCIIEDWRTHGITDLLGVCPWLEQKSSPKVQLLRRGSLHTNVGVALRSRIQLIGCFLFSHLSHHKSIHLYAF